VEEEVATMILSHRGLALVAAAALAVAAFSASAQQPAATDKAPATPTGQADAKKKTLPACQGLKEAECKAKPECVFVPASKRKDGRPIAAYCRAKPQPSAKKTNANTTGKSQSDSKNSSTTPK
jgi:hypothetical protein